MKQRAIVGRNLVVAIGVLGLAIAGAVPAEAATSDPRAAFASRLQRSGRATASFERHSVDPMTGEQRTEAGKLALETPDRVGITFTRTGERLTLRSNGGEWLQPSLEQMITLDSTRAGLAVQWWRLLLGGRSPGLEVERRADGSYGVRTADADNPAASVSLTFGSDGLPRRLEYDDMGGHVSFQFSRWAFSAARGRSAFVLTAPPGYTVAPLP